jgi:hypothetical protein
LGLTLPTSISLRLGGLKGKGKLIIFTCTAIGALTMAVVTFLSKGDGLSEVSTHATAADRAGPVGLLDTDYRHLVTVGKIATALRPEEYESEGVRDPMMAPSGALAAVRPRDSGDERPPEPDTPPNMVLSGIIWDAENPIAMINGLDCQVGSFVEDKVKVVEIHIDSVVLTYKGRRIVLTVE